MYIAFAASVLLIWFGNWFGDNLIHEGNVVVGNAIKITSNLLPILAIVIFVVSQLHKDILKMAEENLTTEGEAILLDPTQKQNNEIDQKIVDAFNEAKKRLGVEKDIKLIRIKNEPLVNAFAISNLKGEGAIVVYDGIAQADKEVLQAVIGHELGHIKNKDSFVTVLLYANQYAVPLLENYSMKLLNLFNELGKGIPWVGFTILAVALSYKLTLYMILLPGKLITHFINLHVSRQQEYLADKAGVEASSKEAMLTLLKYFAQMEEEGQKPKVSQMVEFLMSTHPPAKQRIEYVKNL